MGYKYCILCVKPPMTNRQHQKCLTLAKDKKDWTVAQLSKVLFSDEREDSPIDVTGTQFVEKDIENMAKDELQKLLMEQMDLRKKLEREFQSLKDNFQDQMKRELAYREEMVQQLQIVRDTLCNELDQERKARYAIQQKLKDADTKTLHRELFLQSSNPAPLSYIWAPRKLMYPPAP
ncbi:unnamed protein product [Ranitomeya imitator]|uniref:Uncharacterized protein n=1 Tax=Ranitomeya imitator TaxID=111125 RepID=A0ABN9MEV8_9NEOB|nr:unnamed protein product [Ranitomeya imitator]